MKISELSVGDILELDASLGRNIRWSVEHFTMKVRMDEIRRSERLNVNNVAWTSQAIEIKNMKLRGYTKVRQANGKTKKAPDFSVTYVPGAEYAYNALQIVFPYSFNRVNCTESPAVYLGSESDPFEAFGVKKHHRMLIDGKVCLFSGHDMRFLRKVQVAYSQE